ncbi:MAG TPA: hypothetical protein VFB34_13000, partial [Chloroflexota bacterium]|nr:hypothetical protein [Chloroflexota bacterium]
DHWRSLIFPGADEAAFAFVLLNSSLFYWHYSLVSDTEHINDGIIRRFPVPTSWQEVSWRSLCQRLSENLAENSTPMQIRTKQGHAIEYMEMSASRSKPLIDEADAALAPLFGLSAEELDLVQNYDVKYRIQE